ncbi:uncharacterized protein [Henckelia pumila]|uniref:uncharacterized protein n=1 Tax=Henckelia pumila TaxID=405737 RepID=UPI003C6DFAC6
MALLTFLPDPESKTLHPPPPAANPKRKKKQYHKTKHSSPSTSSSSSWDQIKSLLTCKQIEESQIHHPIYASCSSICTFRDVVHGNTRVVHRSDVSPDSISLGQETRLLSKKGSHGSSSTSRSVNSSYGAGAYAGRGMQLRRLSGCYECHAIVDPSMYPLPRTRICACPECGEVFPKVESLEHHQAIRHAVSELGPDDSSRNIVEIIFKSSWLKKDSPVCKIERILKVHNTQRTIQRFEDYRDAVKTRANSTAKRDARCAADGNELLRFHCATLTCSLGARGSSGLCASVPGCGVCTIVRHGFQGSKISGVRTTASSGRAHDSIGVLATRRAMLVCRVIAGRVKRVGEEAAAGEDDGAAAPLAGSSFDSVTGFTGIYSNLEDLYVFNSRAILPCFVVIYKALEC